MAVSVSIQVEIPESVINDADVRREIEKVLRNRTAPELRRLFNKTTEGWENRPNFSQRFANRVDFVSATVFTTQQQYAIVNFGSPPHPITPKRQGGMLRFQPGYRPATRPKVIGSRAKQRSGPIISAFRVKHPGFAAREFDIAIAEDIAPRFEKDVQDAISVGSSIF